MSAQFLDEGLEYFKTHRNDPDATKKIIEFTKARYPNLLTADSYLSYLKGAIVNEFFPTGEVPLYVKKMVLDHIDRRKVQLKQKDALESRTSDVLAVYNADKLIAQILSGLKSDKMPELFVALALATGRRSTELTTAGTFKRIVGRPDHALFGGQLKRRDEWKIEPYAIPLLASFTAVNKAIKKLRELIKAKPWVGSKEFGQYVKRITGDPRMSPHIMRSMYVRHLYDITGGKYEGYNYNISAFIARLLGHNNLGSAVFYESVHLYNEPPPATDDDTPKKSFYHAHVLDDNKQAVPVANHIYTVDDFDVKGSAESTVITNMLTHYYENGVLPSVNQLRKLNSSHIVINRVLAKNKQLIDIMLTI